MREAQRSSPGQFPGFRQRETAHLPGQHRACGSPSSAIKIGGIRESSEPSGLPRGEGEGPPGYPTGVVSTRAAESACCSDQQT
ncbi:hypothetical protein JZ751_001145 [Albula glossodonta]|uniref:Uncharacterized protein n=1 Tax=Albula glossodonta TaxID=121402 RepID=A0A8T2PT08_9TELE|nr:hypothetical protein JZ751_010190 [Albula glossodonta]KAG9354436.1 hypothetical protein JZ751_001145 [Albula glossodonta]